MKKKKISKWWLFVLVPVCVIMFIALLFMNSPWIFFNKFAFEKGARYAKGIGIDVDWKDLSIETNLAGLFDNRVHITFDDLRVKTPDLEKAHFSHAELSFRYKFTSLIPKIVEIGPVKFTDGEIAYNTPKGTPKGEEKKPFELKVPEIILPKFLRKTHFFPIEVAVKRAGITSPEGLIDAGFTLTISPDSWHRMTAARLEANVKKTPESMNIKIDLNAESESGFRKPDGHVTAEIKLNATGIGSTTVNADLKQRKKTLEYLTDIKFNEKSISAVLGLSGHINEKSILAEVNLDMKDSVSFLNRINIKDCRLTSRRTGMFGNDARLEFKCPADIYLKKIDVPDEIDPIYQPPQVIRLTVNSELDTFFMPDVGHPTKGKINLTMESTQGKLVNTSGHVNLHVDGTMENLPKSMKIGADVDLDFMIKEFDRLVAILNNTSLSLPAPLNALRGELEFSLEGKIPSLESLSQFPVVLKTRLDGPGERFYIDANGETRLMLKSGQITDTDADMDVTLTDILLPLPSLQIAALPRLSPDSRIKTEEGTKEKSEIPLHYEFELRTPPDEPVKITSNLAKKPIPIHLDLEGDEKGIKGTVAIKEFTLRLFRRDALIKKLELDLKVPAQQSTISAEMDLHIIEYLVKVMITGLITKPSIWFESEPPLSEDDILSLMLYGETFDELDADLSASVGNMRSARANKAIALATFFLLASTPVQAIIYDPQTKQFSVRFKLGEKTSLVFGTSGGDDGENQSKGVGIRRRLGKGFMINTSVDYDDDTGTPSASTFLEWHKRY